MVLIQVAVNAKFIQNQLEVSSAGPRMKPVMRMGPSTTPFFSSETKAMKVKDLRRAWMVIFHKLQSTIIENIIFLSGLFERPNGLGNTLSKILERPHQSPGKIVLLEGTHLGNRMFSLFENYPNSASPFFFVFLGNFRTTI